MATSNNMLAYTPKMRKEPVEAPGALGDVTNTTNAGYSTSKPIAAVPGASRVRSRALTGTKERFRFYQVPLSGGDSESTGAKVKAPMFSPTRPSAASKVPVTSPVVVKPFVARHAVGPSSPTKPSSTFVSTRSRAQSCTAMASRNRPSSSSILAASLAVAAAADTSAIPSTVAHSMSLDLAQNLGPSIALLEEALQSMCLPSQSCSTITVQYLDLDRRVITKKVTLPPTRLPSGYEPPEEIDDTFSEVWATAVKLAKTIREAEVNEKLVEVIPPTSAPAPVWDETMLFEEKLLPPPSRVLEDDEVSILSPRPVRPLGVRNIPILQGTCSSIASSIKPRPLPRLPSHRRTATESSIVAPTFARRPSGPRPGPAAKHIMLSATEQGEPVASDVRRGSNDSSGTSSSRATTVTDLWDVDSDSDSMLTSEEDSLQTEESATGFLASLKASSTPATSSPLSKQPTIFQSEASRCAIDDPLFAFVRPASPESKTKTKSATGLLRTYSMDSVYRDEEDADDEATGEIFVSEFGQLGIVGGRAAFKEPVAAAAPTPLLPPIKQWRFKAKSPFIRR